MRTLDLLASDSSHLPFLYVFKESKVMEKYGYEIDLHVVGGAKAPTMAHRAKLALAGEIDFLSGLHHETYRARAKGEKRLTYLAQAQNNWDDRLVVRTSTQVPFHVRRIIAPLLGIPIRRIRVIKPRVGGGFGGKQEILIEDLCGMLTLRTGRPVRLEMTREEELTAARTRHPQILTIKSGVRDGRFTALQLEVLENTGAYGTHALTVMSVTGNRALSLYRCPNLRYDATAVYTNLAVAGAFRGYGCPQGFFALESHVDEVASALGEDPLEFRRRNHVHEGDEQPIAEVLGEGREGHKQVIRSCGLPQAIQLGAKAIGWAEKRLTITPSSEYTPPAGSTVLPLERRPEPAPVPRARRARLQVHLHHPLRPPRGNVRGVERPGGPGQEPGAGPVVAREDQGGASHGEPPRHGPGLRLPGARAAVHPGQRGPHQGLARVRRPPRPLTAS